MQEKFLYGAFTSGGCSSDDGKRCVSLLTNKNLFILNNLQEQGTAPDKQDIEKMSRIPITKRADKEQNYAVTSITKFNMKQKRGRKLKTTRAMAAGCYRRLPRK